MGDTMQAKRTGHRRKIVLAVAAVVLVGAAIAIYLAVSGSRAAEGGTASTATGGSGSGGNGGNSTSATRRARTPMPPVSFPLSKPVSVPMDQVPFKRFGNGVVWGTHIWGDNVMWTPTLPQMQKSLGYTPGALAGFYHLDAATGIQDPDAFLAHARQCADAQTWFFVTLESRVEGLNVTRATLEKAAELLRKASVDLGAPVLVRWCHEFNGRWYQWAQKPIRFKQLWVEFHTMVKRVAPKVGFVWSPNIGISLRGDFTPAEGTAEFRALDTNGNGQLDEEDDPYTPYWPGKQYVDMVGVSFFWFGIPYPRRENQLPTDGVLAGRLRKPYDVVKFATDNDLPFVVSETAGVFFPGAHSGEGPGNVAIKRAWWRQLLAIPEVAMVVWFEVIKFENDYVVDAPITNKTEVAAAFKEDALRYPLVFGPQP